MALSEYDPKKVALFVSALLLVAGTVVAVFVRWRRPPTTGITKSEAQMLVATVGRLIALPTDEEPTIATVTELAPLSNQPFFTHAKVGDRVLIYVKNRRAILYDPLKDKILEVGPFSLTSDASESAQHPQTQSEQLQLEPGYVTVPF